MPTVQFWKAWLTVERTDGTEAHFGPALADYDRLAEEVQRRTFPRAWAIARDRLLDGLTVAFGDLDATPAGLRHVGKLLPWRELKEIAVAQGRLTIKRSKGWLPWAILDNSKVPNPHVLLALVAEARKPHAAAVPAGQPHPDDEHNGE